MIKEKYGLAFTLGTILLFVYIVYSWVTGLLSSTTVMHQQVAMLRIVAGWLALIWLAIVCRK